MDLAERNQTLARIGWLGLLVVGCAAVGVLTGVNPTYGLVAAVGIAFAAVVIVNTSAGLILFTILSFLDVLRSGGAAGSFMKIAGLLLFASWLARAATETQRSDDAATPTVSPVMVAGIALVVWSAITIAWAESSGSAFTDTYRYLLNLLLIPIVMGTVRRRDQVVWLAAAFVFGAVVSTLYGFAVPTAPTGSQAAQLTGTLGDANDQAAVLVGALALACGLIGVFRDKPMLRLLTVFAVLISFAGVVNTLSRSGLIALGAMMVAAVFFGGRWRRWAVMGLIVGAVAVVTYFVAIAPVSARQRVTMSDTSGRSTIWKVGWRMVKANPITGVGSGNFPIASIHYLQSSGSVTRADLIVDTPKVAHNIYLEVLADMGIPGLLAFLALVVGALTAGVRAAQEFARLGDRDLELMSRCVVLALVGFMASDFFLSGQFSKQLWLILALAPALLAMARRRAAQEMAMESPEDALGPGSLAPARA